RAWRTLIAVPRFQLSSARLLLRDFDDDDAARVFEYQSSPAYLEHYDDAVPTRDAVRSLVALFRRWAEELPRRNYQLAITLDSYLIGTCGIRQPAGETAEFGCELDPRFWRHGYAHEASATLLAFARQELQLERVIARTLPANRAAIRLAETLGFEDAGGGLLMLEADRASARREL
ncbi:MAG TPA: GNAT family N-acetyltransferase, partial [Thermoanaerobaculia bacterium]|nr:GNAT family N-acetyltransferase [Thermoanaerobaculia bacterium]